MAMWPDMDKRSKIERKKGEQSAREEMGADVEMVPVKKYNDGVVAHLAFGIWHVLVLC